MHDHSTAASAWSAAPGSGRGTKFTRTPVSRLTRRARTGLQLLLGTTVLGQIPLFPEIRAAGDSGKPIVVAQPGHRAAIAYRSLAKAVLDKLG